MKFIIYLPDCYAQGMSAVPFPYNDLLREEQDPEEMAQRIRALATLLEAVGSIPSTHTLLVPVTPVWEDTSQGKSEEEGRSLVTAEAVQFSTPDSWEKLFTDFFF